VYSLSLIFFLHRSDNPKSINFRHGDLYAAQILYDKRGHWYLIDFGLSEVAVARSGYFLQVDSSSTSFKDDLASVLRLFEKAITNKMLKRELRRLAIEAEVHAPHKIQGSLEKMIASYQE